MNFVGPTKEAHEAHAKFADFDTNYKLHADEELVEKAYQYIRQYY